MVPTGAVLARDAYPRRMDSALHLRIGPEELVIRQRYETLSIANDFLAIPSVTKVQITNQEMFNTDWHLVEESREEKGLKDWDESELKNEMHFDVTITDV